MPTFSKRYIVALLLVAAGAAAGAGGQASGVAATNFPAANFAPANPELSLSDYISALDRCSQTLDRSTPPGAPPEKAALRGLRATLPPQWKVRTGNQTYSVETK